MCIFDLLRLTVGEAEAPGGLLGAPAAVERRQSWREVLLVLLLLTVENRRANIKTLQEVAGFFSLQNAASDDIFF